MVETEKIVLVRYEFVVNLYMFKDTSEYKVCDVFITDSNLKKNPLQINGIHWIHVENVNVVETEEIEKNSLVGKKNKVCGFFDTEPRDWKYAKLVVRDCTKDEYSFSITEVPKSPVMPVVFDVNL
ncbi:MAG: hypothetical protein ACE5KZ_11830 [Candidatus Scalinduaceae bacterium]